MSWCQLTRHGVVIALYVQPSAKKTEVVGEHDGALKIKLAAPPVDGKANLAVTKWLAETLDVPRKAVTLLNGTTSRHKSFAVDVKLCSVEQARTRLLPTSSD